MQAPKSLLAAALLVLATMAGGAFVDWHSEQLHKRQLAIHTGLETIVRLSQELSAMLTMSVLERNPLRSGGYTSVQAKLELTVGNVERLARELELSEDISSLGDERRELRRVELQALAAMQRGEWDDARKALFDDDYVLARKIYEINSETAVGALTGELAAAARSIEQARSVSLALRAGAVGLLLWAGVGFSRRIRRELREQARLRGELSSANRQLERKVQERTAALEAANAKLADLSATDGLTGLPNRRRFDEAFESEWQRAMRQSLPLAAVMVDVDAFKAYNDRYHHRAGDDCLRRIAALLGASVQRAGELAARYGGEEFVVLLPGLEADEARVMAERMRLSVLDMAIEHGDNPAGDGRVSISLGVAAFTPRPGDASFDLIEAADAALFEAKRGGRNRVVVAGAPGLGSTRVGAARLRQ